MKDFTVNGARLVKDRFIRQNTIKEVIQNLRRNKTGKEEKNDNKKQTKQQKRNLSPKQPSLYIKDMAFLKNFNRLNILEINWAKLGSTRIGLYFNILLIWFLYI